MIFVGSLEKSAVTEPISSAVLDGRLEQIMDWTATIDCRGFPGRVVDLRRGMSVHIEDLQHTVC